MWTAVKGVWRVKAGQGQAEVSGVMHEIRMGEDCGMQHQLHSHTTGVPGLNASFGARDCLGDFGQEVEEQGILIRPMYLWPG